MRNQPNSRPFLAALLIVISGLSPALQATPITWYLADVIYSDGGTAYGSFTYDAALDLYSAISIATTAGSNFSGASYFGVAPYRTSNAVQARFAFSPADPEDFDPLMRLDLTSAMTDAGGTIAVRVDPLPGGEDLFFHSEEGDVVGVDFGDPPAAFRPFRHVVSGSITSQPTVVPEPPALALLALALSALTIVRRRRSG